MTRMVPIRGAGWAAARKQATRKRVSHKPRSIELLKGWGWLVEDAEYRDPFKTIPDPQRPGEFKRIPGNKRDQWGFADLVALVRRARGDGDDGWGLAYIQIGSASGANSLSAHRKKWAAGMLTKTGDRVTLPQLAQVALLLFLAWDKSPGNRWRCTVHQYTSRGWCKLSRFTKAKGRWEPENQ